MNRKRIFSELGVLVIFLCIALIPILVLTENAYGDPLDISAGGYHSSVVLDNGTLWTWGLNDFGQLGATSAQLCNTTFACSTYPLQVTTITDWLSVSVGGYHTAALNQSDGFWTWGINDSGQLGWGSSDSCGSIACSTTPGLVGGFNINNVDVYASGYNFTLALKTDGTVWAWGNNSFGQLGNGGGSNSQTPVQVQFPSNTIIVSIVAGGEHSLALDSNNNVWTWGRNWAGAIGDGTTNNRLTPYQVAGLSAITKIEAGAHFSLAVSNGDVHAWGMNWAGQLGDGTTVDKLTPVLISGINSEINNVDQIVGGGDHTIVIKNDGSLWTWGRNDFGQLGWDSSDYCGFTPCSTTPEQVGSDTDWVSVSTRSYHNIALKSYGSLWTWGRNDFGQLGDGTTTQRNVPLNIDTDGDWIVNGVDNCPDVYNPDQTDLDADAIGDVCDCDMDNDGVNDKNCGCEICPPLDNCPSVFNPLQEDQDVDSVGDVCDNCPKVSNPMVNCGDYACQPDANGNGVGNACESFLEAGQFAGGATSITINAGEPAFASATLCNNTNAPIQTIRPEWPYNTVPELYGPDGSLLPISCHVRVPFDVPGDVITMAAGECLTVTGDVSQSYPPEVISLCNPSCTLKTLYFNTIQDPLYGACPPDEQCYNLPLVMVRSTAPSTLTVNTSAPVQRNDAQVAFTPSEWDVKWATENSPGITASISNIAGGHSVGGIVPGSIRLNGTVPGSLIIGNGSATVLFDRAAAVRSLGTPITGTTVFPAVHGSLNDGSLFYGKGSVNIVNKPLSPANLMIQGHTMRVGAGKTPPVTKEPIGSMEIRVYPMSAGSCAAGKGISWQNYPAIWSGCQPSAFGWTGATSGEVGLSVAPGEYLAIAQYTAAGTTVYPGATVGKVSTGLKTAFIKTMLTANGSVLTGKYSVYPGSQLILIEPEYVEWTGTEELYPFVFEGIGDWDVTTSVSPPEGFVADFPALSAEVNTDLKAVQFTIADVGSEWVSTKVNHKIKHKGKTINVNNKIGLKLSPGLQKKLGLGEFGEETNKK